MDGISVILPTLNRHDYLVNTTKSLLCQLFDRPYEIVVIDQSDNNDDEYLTLFQNESRVKYYHVSTFKGLPEARNLGCTKAKFDYVLFLDDDIEFENNLLNEHYKFIIKDEIGIVAGGATEKNRPNADVKHPGSFNFFLAQGYRGFHQKENGYVMHAPGGNFCVKKSLFQKVGGADENFNVGSALGEETDLCMRIRSLGYKVYYNYNAHILHLAAATGGCREEDAEKFVFAMVHNRTLLIHRFCMFYHLPVAYLYTFRLVFAYVKKFKHLFVRELLTGIFTGIKDYHSGVKNHIN